MDLSKFQPSEKMQEFVEAHSVELASLEKEFNERYKGAVDLSVLYDKVETKLDKVEKIETITDEKSEDLKLAMVDLETEFMFEALATFMLVKWNHRKQYNKILDENGMRGSVDTELAAQATSREYMSQLFQAVMYAWSKAEKKRNGR